MWGGPSCTHSLVPLKWGGRGAPRAGSTRRSPSRWRGWGQGGHRFCHPPRLGVLAGCPPNPHDGERRKRGAAGAPSPSYRRVPTSHCPTGPSAPRRGDRGRVGIGGPPHSLGVLRPSAGATVPQPAGAGRSCPSSASPPRGRSSRTGKSAGTRQHLGPGPPAPSRSLELSPLSPTSSLPAPPACGIIPTLLLSIW